MEPKWRACVAWQNSIFRRIYLWYTKSSIMAMYFCHMKNRIHHFLNLAVEESIKGMNAGNGGPFGCVVVKGDEIIGRGHNCVIANNDPTAHAEVEAIRRACERLGSHQLEECEIFCSCEPCPMCLGAIYWARPAKIYFANTKEQAAAIGFDDAFIYREVNVHFSSRTVPTEHVPMEEALRAFEAWKAKTDKINY